MFIFPKQLIVLIAHPLRLIKHYTLYNFLVWVKLSLIIRRIVFMALVFFLIRFFFKFIILLALLVSIIKVRQHNVIIFNNLSVPYLIHSSFKVDFIITSIKMIKILILFSIISLTNSNFLISLLSFNLLVLLRILIRLQVFIIFRLRILIIVIIIKLIIGLIL